MDWPWCLCCVFPGPEAHLPHPTASQRTRQYHLAHGPPDSACRGSLFPRPQAEHLCLLFTGAQKCSLLPPLVSHCSTLCSLGWPVTVTGSEVSPAPGSLAVSKTNQDPCNPRDCQEPPPMSQFKSINSLVFSLLYGPTVTSVHGYWKNHSFDYIDLSWESNVSAF